MSAYTGYAAAQGDNFVLSDGTELTLHAVSDPQPQGDFTGYSLLFRGPADEPLAQGIRSLVHHALGELSLFLVPLGPADGGFEYEAVFSTQGAVEQEAR